VGWQSESLQEKDFSDLVEESEPLEMPYHSIYGEMPEPADLATLGCHLDNASHESSETALDVHTDASSAIQELSDSPVVKELLKLARAEQDGTGAESLIGHPVDIPACRNEDVDEDEVWKVFVTEGDSLKIKHMALLAAQEQTKRELYPVTEP
jgi:hypothetical protein